jgi:cell division protein ZapA
MADQLIPVNIVIADRSYRLRIDPKDEEVVRRTLKVINEKIVEFKTNFSGKDMQDYVAMVLLWFATEQEKPGAAQTMQTDEVEQLNKIEQLLNKALLA